jgi:hypothetical protein
VPTSREELEVPEFVLSRAKLEEVFADILKREDARLRGINHLEATLSAWDEMSDYERQDSVATTLNRLRDY